MRTKIQKIDHASMLALERRRHPWLTLFFRILTVSGQGWFWAVSIMLLGLGIYFQILEFPHQELVLFSMFAPGIAWIIVQAMKLFFKRRRPSQVLPEYKALSPAPKDDSFPSGHTASVFAFFIATLSLGTPASLFIGAWAVLVSFSRYYLGVHFPSDIFVGALIGCLAGTGLHAIPHSFSSDEVYKNFEALTSHEIEGVDYAVEIHDRDSEYLVMAIHGGKIEVGTDELAAEIADGKWRTYFFRAKKTETAKRLHVTSTHFDDPRLIQLAEKSRLCISIHGYEGGKEEAICLGGANLEVRSRIKTKLGEIFPDLALHVECKSIAGTSPKNIGNRCKEKGVQLELSSKLREKMIATPTLFAKFAKAVRSAIILK